MEIDLFRHTDSKCIDEEDIQDAEYGSEEFWFHFGPISREMFYFYMFLCESLQPKYRSIGNEELYSHPLAQCCIEDEQDLLRFLEEFFTPAIVRRMEYTLDVTRDSLLGIDYTKRGLYGSIGCTFLFDICEKARRKAARMCWTSWEPGSGIAVVSGNKSSADYIEVGNTHGEDNSSGGKEDNSDGGGEDNTRDQGNARGQDNAGGQGSGGGQGSQGTQDNGGGQAIFSTVLIQDVRMPFWKSPEKRKSAQMTIRQRTLSFGCHSVIQQVVNSVTGKFDMTGFRDEDVVLYHGTRSLYLSQFQRVGIRPMYTRNELSTESAFYVTDDIHLAYEHPIHKHPGTLELGNSILIFGFRLNSKILCGLLAPNSNEAPFEVRKFLTAEDPGWKKFCVDNRNQVRSMDEYDIVMGPCCTPRGDPHQKDNVDESGKETKLHKVVDVDLLRWDSDQWFRQIAFISRRAQKWLQSHLYCILREVRED